MIFLTNVKLEFLKYHLILMNLNYEVIKQIGKGSFSNVFLCKYEKEATPFLDEDTFIEVDLKHEKSVSDTEDLFIIKEININELVRRCMVDNMRKRESHSRKNQLYNDEVKVNITPFDKDKGKYKEDIDIKQRNEDLNKESRYYNRRFEELIESEIEILSNLDHENIIKFYGYTKEDGIYYLKMEYCDGGDVYEYLKNPERLKDRNCFNGFSNEFVYDFILQTTDALEYLYDKNIIHRDIKLHNVLMKKINGKIQFKISDFGFACYDLSKFDELDKLDLDKVLIKKYYKLCGTPYYMAPEIILNMNKLENIAYYKKTQEESIIFYDSRIDIWSYGICIYELLFNILPFSNIRNIDDLSKFYKTHNIQKRLNARIETKMVINKDFKELLLKMMTINPNARFTIKDIQLFIKTNKQCVLISEENVLDDLINCKENTYLKNEVMKQHIIRNPVKSLPKQSTIKFFGKTEINKGKLKDTNIKDSWEKINKSSSLIMKTSVETGFLKWLLSGLNNKNK